MSRTARVAPPRCLLGQALHAEWTKSRTVPGPTWLLAGVITLTVAVAVAAASAARCQSATCGIDPATVSFTGVYPAQAVAAVAGVLAIGNEYAQATIGATGLPLTPWQSLGVVALWTAGALILGALVLKSRDA